MLSLARDLTLSAIGIAAAFAAIVVVAMFYVGWAQAQIGSFLNVIFP